MTSRLMLGIGLASLLAACGSASDATAFQAPPGFVQEASLGPFVQIWASPDKKSAMMLTAIPAKLDLDETVSRSTVQDADIKAARKLTICGNQAAYYADIVGTVNTSQTKLRRNERIEFLATYFDGKTYMVVYSRPVSAPVDPKADAALRSVCPK